MKRMNDRRNAGFTLSETLVTILILLMVSLVVAEGVPSAVRAYYRVVERSNAELLLSTTVTRLREELGTAVKVEEDDALSSGAGTVTFRHQKDGYKITLTQQNGTGLQLEYTTDGPKAPQNTTLVNSRAGRAVNDNLYVKYADNGLKYDKDNGVFTIGGLTVYRSKDNAATPVKLEEDLVIRTIMGPDNG